MRHLPYDPDDDPGAELERSLLCYQTAADACASVLLTVEMVPAEEERLPASLLLDPPAALAPLCHRKRR